MSEVKIGQVWLKNKIEYLVVEVGQTVMAWSDPDDNSKEEGEVWRDSKEKFFKQFSVKKS